MDNVSYRSAESIASNDLSPDAKKKTNSRTCRVFEK